MKKRKILKYLQYVVEPLESEDFLMLFAMFEALGYKNTLLNSQDYETLKQILTVLYSRVLENTQISSKLRSDDGYLIPYENSWVRLHVLNNKPMGISLYYPESSYKLFLFEKEKNINVTTVLQTKPRGADIVMETLQLA